MCRELVRLSLPYHHSHWIRCAKPNEQSRSTVLLTITTMGTCSASPILYDPALAAKACPSYPPHYGHMFFLPCLTKTRRYKTIRLLLIYACAVAQSWYHP